MYSKADLCDKIHELYPQSGECHIDLKVDWDNERNAWAVDFKKGVHRIKHYLEDEDAAACMEGKQCVSLGLEIGQFVYGVS
ncbi:hypothetical protein D1BOALGB6SA_6331 [Olavius sp. associated proteobacterium Delta 1]|nr:hypothetical protein D1BOALGB6SA_6331 [Olavius sp. associated proteobacterium Delta 1]